MQTMYANGVPRASCPVHRAPASLVAVQPWMIRTLVPERDTGHSLAYLVSKAESTCF